jgi:SAM-dependent methyltransferase
MQPKLEYLYPCLGDDTGETPIEPIYFYQDTWAFEKIIQQHPKSHVDVGSHHKFVALLSKVVPVTMVDIRPLSLPLDSLKFLEGSILDLPFEDESVSSLSSLCVLEHIGLGRYGDPFDPNGTEKAIEELKRVISPGGDLYVSIPIDDQNRIYFNAHRAFDEGYIIKLFDPLIVEEKRYIYGKRFTDLREAGFGIGCYHLRNVSR